MDGEGEPLTVLRRNASSSVRGLELLNKGMLAFLVRSSRLRTTKKGGRRKMKGEEQRKKLASKKKKVMKNQELFLVG